MQCSCGGETVSRKHEVKTQKGIHSRLGQYHDNPIIVDQDTCTGCGRTEVVIFDVKTKERLRRNKR